MIVVNADDYGLSQEVNNAIKESFIKNYIDRTTLMVNMPYADEAVELAFKSGYADKVGLHLNLTAGEPITEACKNSIFTKDGMFNNLFYKVDGKKRFYLSLRERKIIKEEIAAQIKKYVEYELPLMHIDAHHHVHTNLSIVKIVVREAKKAGFKSIRICRTFPGIKESKLKKVYKAYINRIFLEINKDKRNKECFMVQKDDLKKNNFKWYYHGCELEVECHPMYNSDGELTDGIDNKSNDERCKTTMQQLATEVRKIRESVTY